jgi:hydroxypyruvate isomerase
MGKCVKEYDRYLGVQEMMPFAKGVSAKTNDFTPEEKKLPFDYHRMLQIVKDAGYRNWIGIEYEGSRLRKRKAYWLPKSCLRNTEIC